MPEKELSRRPMFHLTKTILKSAGLEPTKARLKQAKQVRSIYGAKMLKDVADLVKENHPSADIFDATTAFVQLGKTTGFGVAHTDGDRKTTASVFQTVAKLHPEASLDDTMRAFRKFDQKLVKNVLKDLGEGKAKGSVYNIARKLAKK